MPGLVIEILWYYANSEDQNKYFCYDKNNLWSHTFGNQWPLDMSNLNHPKFIISNLKRKNPSVYWKGNCLLAVHGKFKDVAEQFPKWIWPNKVSLLYRGSLVECLTRDRGAADWSLTGVTVLCPWATGAQWLSGRVLDWRGGAAGSSLTSVTVLCPWARHIYPCLVLVQARKTRPDVTEK